VDATLNKMALEIFSVLYRLSGGIVGSVACLAYTRQPLASVDHRRGKSLLQ
jgi:hypothetical protein